MGGKINLDALNKLVDNVEKIKSNQEEQELNTKAKKEAEAEYIRILQNKYPTAQISVVGNTVAMIINGQTIMSTIEEEGLTKRNGEKKKK